MSTISSATIIIILVVGLAGLIGIVLLAIYAAHRRGTRSAESIPDHTANQRAPDLLERRQREGEFTDEELREIREPDTEPSADERPPGSKPIA
jgi:uncharacterized membrane protein